MLFAMTEGSEPQLGYRPRRLHKKSRNGCLRCKQRKVKCDESFPRCSWCAFRDRPCEYRQSEPVSRSIMDFRTASQNSLLPTSRLRSSHVDSRVPTPETDNSSTSSFKIANYDSNVEWTDVELFQHYLAHTSFAIPYDLDDLYALRVGIPNLAFGSKPLMSSILALAAVCKAHDLTQQPQQNRSQVVALLVVADRHHRTSLLHIQRDLSDPSQYNYVLANATLMVLYASASHCIRISLIKTQVKNEPLPTEFTITQPQWIPLIRATHLAYVGVLNDDSRTDKFELENKDVPPANTPLLASWQGNCMKGIIASENGPTKRTKELLFPIMGSSIDSALIALRTKARATEKNNGHGELCPRSHDAVEVSDSLNGCGEDRHACFVALDILEQIATEVFSTKHLSPSTTFCFKESHLGLAKPSFGQRSMISGWLQSYVARVTSSAKTSQRPLRRVIMAFLNRVPTEYLLLVQTTLDSIDMQSNTCQDERRKSKDFETHIPSAASKLAIEIFAHWLVLVMLLDGVWWIGAIGAWELRRVISFVRVEGWLTHPTHMEEYWWPESMHKVARELSSCEYLSCLADDS